MIDDENLHGSLLRLEFHPKLFLKRRGNRSLAPFCRQLQREIIVAGKSGLIHDDAAAQLLRQQLHEVRERNALTDHFVTFRLQELTTSARAAAKAFESAGVRV